MKRKRTLQSLYDLCPEVPCIPGCMVCCTIIPWNPTEFERVRSRIPRDARVLPYADMSKVHRMMAAGIEPREIPVLPGMLTILAPTEHVCAFRDSVLGCTVHEDRPFTCRVYGTWPLYKDGAGCQRGVIAEEPIDERRAMAAVRVYLRMSERDAERVTDGTS